MHGDDLAIFLFFLTLVFTFVVEAVKAETLARRVGFGILAGAFLIAGVFWSQLKQSWPQLADWVTPVATNPMAWFIVFMFLVAVFAFSPTKRKVSASRRDDEEKENEGERIFVDVDPLYLIRMGRGMTSLRADALTAPYRGKWIKASGVTGNMSDVLGMGISVIVDLPHDKEDGREYILAFFRNSWRSRVELLQEKKTITVIGRIQKIESRALMLYDCELT